VVALTATLGRVKLYVEADNALIDRWRAEVANVYVHVTTRERPATRLTLRQRARLARLALLMLPDLRPVLQRGNLQHPLMVHDARLEIAT